MSGTELIGVGGLVALLALLALRMPVGLAMILVGVAGSYALSLEAPYLRFAPYLAQFKTLLWGVFANYNLSVVPLFILMGTLAAHARLGRDLFQGVNVLLGGVRGGAAMAAIGACAGFGAVCGSSLATASTVGRVALPELRRLGYPAELATGALAAGGTLGILIPPSVVLVIYAVTVDASILEMFQAAVVPGGLAVVFFLAVIAVTVRRRPAGRMPEPGPAAASLSPAARRAALWRLVPVVVLFSSLIGGLALGLFTPTPAAAVGVFAVLTYGGLARLWGDGLTLDGLGRALLDAASTIGMIYLILFGAEVLKGFFSRAGLPAALAAWTVEAGLDPWAVLVAMLVLLLVLGCFMDSLSMILVVVPFLWPALVSLNGGAWVPAEAAGFGLDTEALKVWFGILALVVVEVGLITPPVGLNVFIIHALARDVSMAAIFRGVSPFLVAELVRVALIILVPGLTLALPRWFAG